MSQRSSRYERTGVLVAVLSLACSLFTPSFAHATSVYDEVVELTESLHLSRDGTIQGSPACAPVNITTSWEDILTNSSSWTPRTQIIGGATQTATLADWATTLSNGVGWAVVQQHNNNASTPNWGSPIADAVYVVFTPSTSAQINFSSNPVYWGTQKQAYMTNTNNDYVYSVRIQFDDLGAAGGDDQCTPVISMALREPSSTPTFWENESVAATSTLSSGGYSLRPLFANALVNYPTGYEGVQLPISSTWADLDGDGLIAVKESAQGTSNANKDTDGDGLDDFIESQWYIDRNAVFCGLVCAYPDPIVKDVYVEVDWMNNPNDGSYKPSNNQLDQVIDAFDVRGINIHFDTGQYGGGSELPSYENTLAFAQDSNNFDFYDYKNGTSTTNANFDDDRKRIWHYMISGYQYAENTGSSGASYAGDDDFFVSYGLIKDGQSSFGYTSLDTAIGGTIIHELGHNLCLTNSSAYSGQSGACVYSGIDNVNASSDYESSMNYSYQMFMVDYSDGANSAPNDHDDWSAVDIGLKDFSSIDRDTGDVMNGASREKSKKLIQGITIEKAQDLRKKNMLGRHNMNYFNRQQTLMR